MWKYLILLLLSLNSFSQSKEELDFIKKLNESRSVKLEYSEEYRKLAFYHTEYMNHYDKLSHDNYDNRVKEIHKKHKSYIGECVAYGENVYKTLMSSPEHKKILLNDRYKNIAINIKNKYVTVILYE